MASAWRRTCEAFLGDFAQAAHRQAGTGEGMALDELLGQPQFQTEPPHLVLEQVAQRFDQLEPHLLGQTADVVVQS